MKHLYIISKCIVSCRSHSILHFNGYYMGHRIEAVKIDERLREGQNYLIKIVNPIINNGTLTGTILKKKGL